MPKYTFSHCSFQQFQPPKSVLFFGETHPSICRKEERNCTKRRRRCRLRKILSPFDGIESPFRENKTPKEFTQSAIGCNDSAIEFILSVCSFRMTWLWFWTSTFSRWTYGKRKSGGSILFHRTTAMSCISLVLIDHDDQAFACFPE